MDRALQDKYVGLLRRELIPALGCTEPIAIAYAAAKAREVLGRLPERVELCCSGNIIKNVKSVTVPNSGGMRGVGAAAVLGVLAGQASRELEVLEEIGPEEISRAKQLLQSGYFSCTLQKDVENLYVAATVYSGEHSARVTIINRHTLITEIVRDGELLYRIEPEEETERPDRSFLNVRDILEFAGTVALADVEPLLDRQVAMNSAIAAEGLKGGYGAEVGKTLLESGGGGVQTRARAMAAAGSDARMGGCAMPVVINSGSGNQGMTVSLPVIAYAGELKVSKETLYRALLISNLVSIHQKEYIGSLSAFCGAVTAACGAGAAITYLYGGGYEEISRTIVNTLANIGGIVCDGAKPSCAAKIASAVDAAILANAMSRNGRVFHSGEGIVQEDVEHTMRSVGYVGRVGMKVTDEEILSIMLDEINLDAEEGP